MDPSLLEVYSQSASSDATAAVAENLWPRVRNVGGLERSYCNSGLMSRGRVMLASRATYRVSDIKVHFACVFQYVLL